MFFNKETLGLRLDSEAQINAAVHQTPPKEHSIEDIFEFTWNLMGTLMSFQNNMHLNENDGQRTIYINTGTVSAVDFDLDKTKKDFFD
ncbi:hypothetical protein RCO48_02435 [Peribacillus frigoritolerans]|nr:hypothetical protein [Peribacillus frigoritolerans]